MTKRSRQNERLSIAAEIIRCRDTVTLLTIKEVRDIYRRAESGEFDDLFSLEEEESANERHT